MYLSPANFMDISQSYQVIFYHKVRYLQTVFQSEPIECNCKFSYCLSVAPPCILMLTMHQLHLCLLLSVLHYFCIYCPDCQLFEFSLIPHCTYTFNGPFLQPKPTFFSILLLLLLLCWYTIQIILQYLIGLIWKVV